MPKVKQIINILSNPRQQDTEIYNVETFRQKEKEFKKEHAQARDFVKFLLTLERQFKNISKGELKQIEETLPSLMNGLKLIWTISRHINKKEDDFQDILEAISNEICQKVRNKINIKTIFKVQPATAIIEIDKAITVLEKWNNEFNKTKMDIEGESTITRWDFPRMKDIFLTPKHMVNICKDLKEVCIICKDFKAILNTDLKAVTGSSDLIDQVADRVTEQVNKLQTIQTDVFLQENKRDWDTCKETFDKQITSIEQETVALINNTFKENLNSSLGAFELLDHFKHIETREEIQKTL